MNAQPCVDEQHGGLPAHSDREQLAVGVEVVSAGREATHQDRGA